MNIKHEYSDVVNIDFIRIILVLCVLHVILPSKTSTFLFVLRQDCANRGSNFNKNILPPCQINFSFCYKWLFKFLLYHVWPYDMPFIKTVSFSTSSKKTLKYFLLVIRSFMWWIKAIQLNVLSVQKIFRSFSDL